MAMHLNHPIKKLKLSLRAVARIDNWWDYFFDYLNLKKGYITYKIEGKKIKTRAGTIDRSIFTEVALENLYFPSWLKLRENATVVDVGAHIGIFSVLVSSRITGGRVYAIEPCKDNFNLLLEQTKINDFDILPFNLALTNKAGKMKLYSGSHSARGSLLREEGGNFEFVKTMTLKKFFEKEKIKKCDLLKVDIEGGEYPLFYSTPKKIFDKIDRIFMEVHKIEGEDRKEMMNFLEKKGFDIEVKEEGFIYATKDLS